MLIVGIRTRVNAEAALSAAQQLRSQYPNIAVVVIAEAGDGYALELLRSGAAGVGYLLDDRIGDLETLLGAVRRSRGRHRSRPLDRECPGATRLPSTLDALSVRELNVLAEMACGYCNDEIARRLTVSKKAVEGHVTGIFRKLGYPTPNASTAAWPRS